MYASNSHSDTHLILALCIVREPTVWGFITSEYPGIHDTGLPTKKASRMIRRPHEKLYSMAASILLYAAAFSVGCRGGGHCRGGATHVPRCETREYDVPARNKHDHRQFNDTLAL